MLSLFQIVVGIVPETGTFPFLHIAFYKLDFILKLVFLCILFSGSAVALARAAATYTVLSPPKTGVIS